MPEKVFRSLEIIEYTFLNYIQLEEKGLVRLIKFYFAYNKFDYNFLAHFVLSFIGLVFIFCLVPAYLDHLSLQWGKY